MNTQVDEAAVAELIALEARHSECDSVMPCSAEWRGSTAAQDGECDFTIRIRPIIAALKAAREKAKEFDVLTDPLRNLERISNALAADENRCIADLTRKLETALGALSICAAPVVGRTDHGWDYGNALLASKETAWKALVAIGALTRHSLGCASWRCAGCGRSFTGSSCGPCVTPKRRDCTCGITVIDLTGIDDAPSPAVVIWRAVQSDRGEWFLWRLADGAWTTIGPVEVVPFGAPAQEPAIAPTGLSKRECVLCHRSEDDPFLPGLCAASKTTNAAHEWVTSAPQPSAPVAAPEWKVGDEAICRGARVKLIHRWTSETSWDVWPADSISLRNRVSASELQRILEPPSAELPCSECKHTAESWEFGYRFPTSCACCNRQHAKPGAEPSGERDGLPIKCSKCGVWPAVGSNVHSVVCPRCHRRTAAYDNPRESVAAWNRMNKPAPQSDRPSAAPSPDPKSAYTAYTADKARCVARMYETSNQFLSLAATLRKYAGLLDRYEWMPPVASGVPRGGA